MCFSELIHAYSFMYVCIQWYKKNHLFCYSCYFFDKKKIVLQNIENIYINNWYTYLKRTFNLQILQITMNYWLWKYCSNVCMYIHKYVWIPMCMYIHRYVLYMFIFLLIFCFLSVCIFIRVRIICSRKSKFVVKYAL